MSILLTWANYAFIVSVCLVVYYFIVVLLFYRKGLQSLWAKKETEPSLEADHPSSNHHSPNQKSNLNLFGEEVKDEEALSIAVEQDFSPDAQDFADEIVAYTSSSGDGIEKEELLLNLRKIILKYPSLIDSESRYELSQIIAISSENDCSIHLSADEVSELWKG